MNSPVALLAEGVDRNPFCGHLPILVKEVALLAEGVDRNLVEPAVIADVNLSPSSRRAWIEISWASATSCKMFVALLAEGVDRNLRVLYARYVDRESPSSRRAWIEIR